MRLSSRTLLFVALIGACCLSAPETRAIIVHGTPIVVQAHGRGSSARTFVLTGAAEGLSDSGSAERSQCADGQVLSGTETLHGRFGTLTLDWTARRHSSGEIRGTWTLAAAVGAYTGFRGHGDLVAQRTLANARYTGLLIAAV